MFQLRNMECSPLSFGFRHSFDIRHSTFDIRVLLSAVFTVRHALILEATPVPP